MQEKPTNLTKDGVKSLVDKNFKGSYFQIIEVNTLAGKSNISTSNSDKNNEKLKYFYLKS